MDSVLQFSKTEKFLLCLSIVIKPNLPEPAELISFSLPEYMYVCKCFLLEKWFLIVLVWSEMPHLYKMIKTLSWLMLMSSSTAVIPAARPALVASAVFSHAICLSQVSILKSNSSPFNVFQVAIFQLQKCTLPCKKSSPILQIYCFPCLEQIGKICPLRTKTYFLEGPF